MTLEDNFVFTISVFTVWIPALIEIPIYSKMTMISYAWWHLESKICFWINNYLKLLYLDFTVKIPGSFFVAFFILKFTKYHVTSKWVKSLSSPMKNWLKSTQYDFLVFTNFQLFTLFFDTAKILYSTHVLRDPTDGASNWINKKIFIMILAAKEVAKYKIQWL